MKKESTPKRQTERSKQEYKESQTIIDDDSQYTVTVTTECKLARKPKTKHGTCLPIHNMTHMVVSPCIPTSSGPAVTSSKPWNRFMR